MRRKSRSAFAVRHPDKAVLDHRVAAAPLGHVEAGIGCLDQVGRVLAGDRVNVEMTPYDLSKGRITFRFK